jgi:hypothetical protein
MTDPYRADQVVSLLRPPELLAARDAAAAGRISAEDLRAVEDRAILDALEMQRRISPQCGFASVAAGNQVSMDDQSRKLALVAETARRIWG